VTPDPGRPSLAPDQYRFVVENGPLLIRRMGPAAKCDYVNEAWLRFTGRSFDQEVGDGWVRGVHPDDLPGCLATYSRQFERRNDVEMEYRLMRHDGVYRYIWDREAPLRDHRGDFVGYIGSCIDIQDRKEAEEATGALLRMMAHELRTPLSSMRMFVEIMRRAGARGVTNPPESFAKLDAQIDRLDRLVNDLSRSGRQKELELSLESLELGNLVKRVVESRWQTLRETREDLRHWIEWEGIEQSHWVRADRLRLEQVFTNLLDNALKYSPRGGTIRIALGEREGMHFVSFADPGIGVPAKETPLLTRQFFRASNASRENYPGLGLGLSLVNEIIAGHRGALRFHSELDKGTTVTVCLPASDRVDARPRQATKR
jgi:PAS domain S-box-containing protein